MLGTKEAGGTFLSVRICALILSSAGVYIPPPLKALASHTLQYTPHPDDKVYIVLKDNHNKSFRLTIILTDALVLDKCRNDNVGEVFRVRREGGGEGRGTGGERERGMRGGEEEERRRAKTGGGGRGCGTVSDAQLED